jgi:hypothetical protein
MGIVFFCQSCGARFEVDARFAGKQGRCKRCGQMMSIPHAEQLASMVAMPALAAADVESGVGASPPGQQEEGLVTGAWLKAGVSQAALAPITVDRMPVGFKRPTKPSPLDDAEDSKPYVLAKPLVERRGSVSPHNNIIVRVWRQQLGGVQKLFRKINQTAYLFSIPFIMILLFGALVGKHQIALFGATGVVLLNIGRIAAGIANLAVIPFRDGINLNKMRKPLWRVIEPALTIVVVLLAFTFVPGLSSANSAKGNITDRIRSGAEDLKTGVKSQVGEFVDVDKLGAKARDAVDKLKKQP